MALVALLSNPRSTGNQSLLPRIRSFCAQHDDIFHYEVERVEQIDAALRSIARVKPKVLVINGGDGTVQATLTELHQGSHFAGGPPPVAVLPNGKTNLIALDLGAGGDAIWALERVLEMARTDLESHIVSRELISLSEGVDGRPVLGMFLGGAALAETMLYCREKIYPLGLPNWLAHFIAMVMGLLAVLIGRRASFLPTQPPPLTVTVLRAGALQGRFALIMVTTLRRVLFSGNMPTSGSDNGSMQLLVIERSIPALLRALVAAIRGRLGRHQLSGVHLRSGDEIRIEGSKSAIVMDGEMFETGAGRPIVLRPTRPVPFLKIAA